MFYISTRVRAYTLGLTAASLVFGGVQFGMASDHGFVRTEPRWDQDGIAAAVNRFAKTDRDPLPSVTAESSTLVYQLNGLEGTSVAVRLPNSHTVRSLVGPALLNRAAKANEAANKLMIACEPVVSRLTAVAKELGSGRCMT
jgi:hypothetical protein